MTPSNAVLVTDVALLDKDIQKQGKTDRPIFN